MIQTVEGVMRNNYIPIMGRTGGRTNGKTDKRTDRGKTITF